MQALLRSPTNFLKGVFAFGVMTVCGALLWQQIAAIPRQDILQTFQAIAPWQWALACLATLGSFMAVGRYDAVWHRRLNTNVTPAQARRTGMAAIAIGQTIGVGTITGAFVRWHLLSKLGFKTTTGITIGVSISFLSCWALLGVMAGVLLGVLPVFPMLVACVVLFISLRFLPPSLSNKVLSFRADAFKLLSLTAIDVGLAGIALWALIPDAHLALIIPVLAVYTVALGAGLISNAPGGLGAFDLCVLTLLPMLPEADLLAAILAFRIIYYLIPAGLAAALLVAVHLRNARFGGRTDAPISDLCHQGAKLKKFGATMTVVRKHLLGTVAIEPALHTADARFFDPNAIGFRAHYKANRRLAAQARAHGWAIRRIADDALIDPVTWRTEGASKRQLRRKIAQATKTGVRVTLSNDPLPIDDMTQIANVWSAHHGGELGYSMGRFCADYIANQRVYLIWDQATLCGFITVQARTNAWAIDVIRHGTAMPSGAIHAAYAAIIADAGANGAKTLSLGAVPTANTRCKHQLRFRTAKAGLVQFKQSFEPRWVPLYHTAPTRLQWAVSMIHIVWHVQRPVPRIVTHAMRLVKSFIIMSSFFHLNRPLAHGKG